jgi:hypothetical protein
MERLMRKETKNTIKISQMNTLITKIMIQIFELHNFTGFCFQKVFLNFFLNYFYFKLIIFIILNGFDILISKINFKK